MYDIHIKWLAHYLLDASKRKKYIELFYDKTYYLLYLFKNNIWCNENGGIHFALRCILILLHAFKYLISACELGRVLCSRLSLVKEMPGYRLQSAL